MPVVFHNGGEVIWNEKQCRLEQSRQHIEEEVKWAMKGVISKEGRAVENSSKECLKNIDNAMCKYPLVMTNNRSECMGQMR